MPGRKGTAPRPPVEDKEYKRKGQMSEVVRTRTRRGGANKGSFKPGHPPTPGSGRRKGSRDRLGHAFILALHDDFEKHGTKAIRKCRDDNPTGYLKIIASIMPKELTVNKGVAGNLSDDELATLLDAVRAQVIDGTARRTGERVRDAAEAEQIELIPAVPETESVS